MNLFTYGTLMIPEIISSLLGRNLTGVGALLKDYRRALILNQTYPGICRQGESQVVSVLCGKQDTTNQVVDMRRRE